MSEFCEKTEDFVCSFALSPLHLTGVVMMVLVVVGMVCGVGVAVDVLRSFLLHESAGFIRPVAVVEAVAVVMSLAVVSVVVVREWSEGNKRGIISRGILCTEMF